MTGRQDVSPVASVKAENIKKELQSYQGQDEMIRRQEIIKPTKRVSVTQKQTRPPMEIYRPPKTMHKNGTKVHFADDNAIKRSPPPSINALPIELKSALKRSKSFTADESKESHKSVFLREGFPKEFHGLIRQAMIDPTSLSVQKLMELVGLICKKAVESVHYSKLSAELCFSIIEKEHDHTFLESLQNCCREWYNERDKLLRVPCFSPGGTAVSGLHRWTAYVTFLKELYRHVKDQHSQITGAHPNSPMLHLALTLQTLLYECANISLKPSSLSFEGEVEILREMLNDVGKQLEAESPHRMQILVSNLRDAFISPSISAQIRKTLLEVIELHASSWQLDLPQKMYYFPYTKI